MKELLLQAFVILAAPISGVAYMQKGFSTSHMIRASKNYDTNAARREQQASQIIK